MAGEREHILNRFPSSVRDVFMWRAEPARYMHAYIPMLLEDPPLFSAWGAPNLKGLKRFPRGWRVRLSALERRSTDEDSFSPTCRALSCPPLDPFPLLVGSNSSAPLPLPPPTPPFLFLLKVVTYCELLREPCRRAGEKGSACFPFDAENFRRREKWC